VTLISEYVGYGQHGPLGKAVQTWTPCKNGRMCCCSGRGLIFFVGALFFSSEPYFSRRDDVLAVTGLIFPVGTMFLRSEPYFVRRDDVLTVTGLILFVGTMFWRSPALFCPSGRNSGGRLPYFAGKYIGSIGCYICMAGCRAWNIGEILS